jgi:multidrug resistance efflux pump
VAANIKEGDIARVRVGQEARVEIDAFPGRLFAGRVDSIGRATSSTFSLLAAQSGGGNYTKVVQVVPIKIALVDIPRENWGVRGGQCAADIDLGFEIEV